MSRVTIEEFFKKIHQNLIHTLIYQISDDVYILYDQYSVQRHDKSFIVTRFRDQREFKFNRIRNATAWAILDKHNKFYEATRLYELDTKLEGIKIDVAIHRRLKNTDSLEDYLIYSDKYENDLIRQQKFQRELDKYIIMAKYCQQRGFENELNRTSGKQKEQVS